MPQTKKLAWAQLRVGLMAIVAILILVVLTFLLTGRVGLFVRTARLRTYVNDSVSLKEGADVRLNGIKVGSVASVDLSGEADPRRQIRIVMEIHRDFLPRIPVDSETAIDPEGVFGDKYINVTRGKNPQSVADGAEIASIDPTDFPELIKQGHTVMGQLNSITRRINTITEQVEKGRGTIGKLLYDDSLYKRVDAVVARAQTAVDAVADGKGTIGKLLFDDQLYRQADAAIRRVDTVVADVQAGKGTLGMLLQDAALYENARGITVEARQLLDDLNAGKGTAGKFLKDETLHQQIRTTLGRLDTTMERLDSGQGTLGQLLVNRALYDSMHGLTGEMQGLMKDFRANPKKFLRIKLALF